jgi:hypothetical protein
MARSPLRFLLFRLAAQNIGRRRLRALFLGIAVMLAVGVGFASFTAGWALRGGISTTFSRMGADLVVVPFGTLVNITSTLLTVQPTEQELDAGLADRLRAIPVPDCQVLEDLVVSEDNRTWYLTCMGSSTVIMGDAVKDAPIKTVRAAEPAAAFILNPHGIAIHNGIDRVLITSTVKPDNKAEAGETVTVLEASTGTVLSTHKVSSKPSPSKAAPVEVMFAPKTNPPVVHITNMFEGTLWAGIWDPTAQSFSFNQVDDFGAREQEMPLEMLYNAKGDRLYVTTAKPGSAMAPLPGISARVVDDHGNLIESSPEFGEHASGYLVLDQPWPAMLRGIWGDPERYKETYWSRFAEQGWYFAGDGARYDLDGAIWLLGRVDDVMNVSGHRISTAEVESALVGHSGVAEAAVVGATDDTTGQAIVAFVVLMAHHADTPREQMIDELRAEVAREISPIARPREIHVVPELPKTRSGKIMRRLLRDVAEGRELGDTSALLDPSVFEAIRASK